jgi:hypothetical protein
VVVAGRLRHEVNLEKFEAKGVYPGDQALEPRLIGHTATHRRHAVTDPTSQPAKAAANV